MYRTVWMLILAATLVSLAGCRNCRPFCGQCAGNPTIAPPATYSLQTGNANNQYYNGATNTAQQPGYLINPNQPAPTPTSNSPTLSPNQGWRPTGTNGYSQYNSSPYGNGSMSVVESSTVGNNAAPARTASVANGVSFKDSVNYQTTTVDERRDATRLPATDASAVRAPAPLYPQVTPGNQFAANAVGQPGNLRGTVEFYNQPTGGVPTYNAYPAVASQGFLAGSAAPTAQPQPTVLAQSTVTYDPRDNPNYEAGWRDRELTDGRNLNR